MDKPVYFSDLVPCSPLKAAEISMEDRRKFLDEVEAEVERIWPGGDARLKRSEQLTGEDYATRINARVPGLYIIGGSGGIVDVV